MDLIITILPVVTKDLPIPPRFTPYDFYRDASPAILQLVNQWLNFYLLTFPSFPLRKKEHKSYFGKNRTHDFRTSKCAGYLLDHSGDERLITLTKHTVVAIPTAVVVPTKQVVPPVVVVPTAIVLLVPQGCRRGGAYGISHARGWSLTRILLRFRTPIAILLLPRGLRGESSPGCEPLTFLPL